MLTAKNLKPLLETLAPTREAFGVVVGETISLVGAGGKTTLMYALAREMARDGLLAVTTTTTKILPPSSTESDVLFVDDEKALFEHVLSSRGRHSVITVARRSLDSGKLEGVGKEFVDRLAGTSGVSAIIVESDGSARCSLKAPNGTEPVIPATTSLVIAVAGMRTLGCPLDYEHVFRAEIAAELLGKPLGSTIGPADIARLITHDRGVPKGSPVPARIVPFLNQVDLAGDLAAGRATARAILDGGHPQISRVVIGEARRETFLVVKSNAG